MVRPFKAALNTEKSADGGFEWVITFIDSTVATMPQIERSTQTYATEDEALRAGEAALDRLQDD
ncbi:hypothetical protein CR159_12085 [Pollutimonas subterranea]|uniref:Uncharacterized protein n=1 Tax=Pollutimonas subterranea TaxID=2045210 RepID=A0A2N4U3Q5_9BURK|nr:hypothetical protein [Pollutimonas subterranea]PLC49655.1 hypothetical protein CR159_12085 [Pollutimonas subterranea]